MNAPVVVLVEDHAQNSYFARYLLEAAGLRVMEFAHAGDALVWLEAGHLPAAIVTDIQMADIDGYEFAALLKADPRWRSIPLAAATSFAMVGDRHKALAMGFDAYYEKPLDPETFGAEIRRLSTRAGGFAP